MKRWLKLLIVGVSAVAAGVVAYIVALALGASHTVCTGSASAGYCDTHAGVWALIALLIGLMIGASASAWSLWTRKPS